MRTLYFQTPFNLNHLLKTLTAISIMVILAILALSNTTANSSPLFSSQILTLSFFFFGQWIITALPLMIIAGPQIFKPQNLLIKKIPLKTALKETLFFYLLFIGTAILILLALSSILNIPPSQLNQGTQDILQYFNTNPFHLTILAFIIILIGPLLEEIFFRGFLLPITVNHFGKTLGNIIPALLFSALHGLNFKLLIILPLALILNHLTIKHKSIIPALLLHITNNALVFIIVLKTLEIS